MREVFQRFDRSVISLAFRRLPTDGHAPWAVSLGTTIPKPQVPTPKKPSLAHPTLEKKSKPWQKQIDKEQLNELLDGANDMFGEDDALEHLFDEDDDAIEDAAIEEEMEEGDDEDDIFELLDDEVLI